MKIKFLLLGTSLSFIPNLTFAQCVATQDCETLGYTETSCNGGKGVKCPFGNKWACLPTKESICKEEGFTLACNETGQTGDGDSCNGLYKQCSCDSSYQYTCSGTGLAIRATNTLARVRATPVVWAPPVVASMRLVPAPLATNGKMAVAGNKHRMEQLASCIIAMAKLLVYVLRVWASMSR